MTEYDNDRRDEYLRDNPPCRAHRVRGCDECTERAAAWLGQLDLDQALAGLIDLGIVVEVKPTRLHDRVYRRAFIVGRWIGRTWSHVMRRENGRGSGVLG